MGALKKALLVGAKLAVTGIILWIVFADLELSEVIEQLRRVQPSTIVVCLVIFISHFLAVAIRWQALVSLFGHEIGIWRATRLVAIGSFFNQVFFGTIAGDAIRILNLRSRDTNLTVAAGSVLLDRYLALFTVWLALIAMLPVFYSAFVGFPRTQLGLLSLCALGTASLLLPIASLLRFVETLDLLRPLHGIYRFILSLSSVLLLSCKDLAAFTRTYLPSAFIVLSSSLAVFLIAGDVGAPVNFSASVLVTTASLLVSAIPITVAGWGLRELSFVSLLQALSIDRADSLVISVLFGLLVLGASLLGGLAWLVSSDEIKASESAAAQNAD